MDFVGLHPSSLLPVIEVSKNAASHSLRIQSPMVHKMSRDMSNPNSQSFWKGEEGVLFEDLLSNLDITIQLMGV